MGTFSGIYVALQSILAQQKAMEITEHNVANANTIGYHRQEAIFKASVPEKTMMETGGAGDMGSGVLISQIRRYSLQYYDTRLRNETAMTSQYKKSAEILKNVEINLSDTAKDSIGTLMDTFFASWQTVSNDPDLSTLRAVLVSDAKSLANAFNNRYQSLIDVRNDKNLEIKQLVDEVNTIASQIAKLNGEIGRSMAVGNQPNDLMDERDRQLSRLAEITGVQAYVQGNGQVVASINGHALVVGNNAFKLNTSLDANGLTQIAWEDGQPFDALSGEIAGIMDVRDRVIPDQMNQINETARVLAARVNAVHAAGYGMDALNTTGLAMFVVTAGSEALSISVNADLDDPLKVAAATTGDAPGDGNNALAIANIYDELIMNGNSITLRQYNGERVTKFALEAQAAETRAANHQNVADALSDQVEEVSGVSLDEEAANMLKYQRAYQAAVRLMTTMDEMLEQMINGMGIVGR